jgi:hypothetical protein
MGFLDPLVVRREENEARAKAVPPSTKVVIETSCTSWRVGGLFPDFLLFLAPNSIVGLLSLLEDWRDLLPSLRFQQHFHLPIAFQCVRAPNTLLLYYK